MQSTPLVEKPLHSSGPMAGKPIPDQQDGVAEMSGEIPQEFDQPHGGDVGVGAHGKVKSHPPLERRERKSRDARDFFSRTSALIQDRGPASGSPTATDQRSQQQPAFVQEDQRRFQLPRFFLIRGQLSRTQRRMASSSRSRARRSGFWGLQPIECSNRLR